VQADHYPKTKDENWKDYNHKAIRTIGWAIKEMYKELKVVYKNAEEEMKERTKIKTKAITAVRLQSIPD
jgi:hypothetical protein